jgi:putative addiction module component (TIGR02574 family)
MTERASDVLEQALKLSTEERALLAAELLASVDGEPDADAASAWAAEIDARIARVKASGPTGDDWAVVRERVAQGLRRE